VALIPLNVLRGLRDPALGRTRARDSGFRRRTGLHQRWACGRARYDCGSHRTSQLARVVVVLVSAYDAFSLRPEREASQHASRVAHDSLTESSLTGGQQHRYIVDPWSTAPGGDTTIP
jgi:hypothetical protein